MFPRQNLACKDEPHCGDDGFWFDGGEWCNIDRLVWMKDEYYIDMMNG